MSRSYVPLLVVIVSTVSEAGYAAPSGDAVPPGYRAVAHQTGVPAELLYAVALTESGRSVSEGVPRRPWPWTLNIAGQGQFFASRTEAWRALEKAFGDGEERIDVGLMQVNWRYHRTLLKSSWQALEPYANLRAGARILADCYRERREWWASVGCYHSPGDRERARRYRERVLAHWRSLQASP